MHCGFQVRLIQSALEPRALDLPVCPALERACAMQFQPFALARVPLHTPWNLARSAMLEAIL